MAANAMQFDDDLIRSPANTMIRAVGSCRQDSESLQDGVWAAGTAHAATAATARCHSDSDGDSGDSHGCFAVSEPPAIRRDSPPTG